MCVKPVYFSCLRCGDVGKLSGIPKVDLASVEFVTVGQTYSFPQLLVFDRVFQTVTSPKGGVGELRHGLWNDGDVKCSICSADLIR